eukprot:1185237-Prorocentrum_minimum.AAC.2
MFRTRGEAQRTQRNEVTWSGWQLPRVTASNGRHRRWSSGSHPPTSSTAASPCRTPVPLAVNSPPLAVNSPPLAVNSPPLAVNSPPRWSSGSRRGFPGRTWWPHWRRCP